MEKLECKVCGKLGNTFKVMYVIHLPEFMSYTSEVCFCEEHKLDVYRTLTQELISEGRLGFVKSIF